MCVYIQDNPLNQQILQKRLERDGHILTLANDGVECLDHFKASLTDPIHPLFDLIIMDVQMPRMDGYEATRSIRTLEHQLHSTTTTYTPILAVSAHSYKSDLNSCKDSGMDGYATKPIVFARLKRLLEDVWEWRVNGTGWEVSVEGGDGIAGWF